MPASKSNRLKKSNTRPSVISASNPSHETSIPVQNTGRDLHWQPSDTYFAQREGGGIHEPPRLASPNTSALHLAQRQGGVIHQPPGPPPPKLPPPTSAEHYANRQGGGIHQPPPPPPPSAVKGPPKFASPSYFDFRDGGGIHPQPPRNTAMPPYQPYQPQEPTLATIPEAGPPPPRNHYQPINETRYELAAFSSPAPPTNYYGNEAADTSPLLQPQDPSPTGSLRVVNQ
jgi:hypothetical protein